MYSTRPSCYRDAHSLECIQAQTPPSNLCAVSAMQNSSFIQNFSGTICKNLRNVCIPALISIIDASGRAVVGVQYTSPHNEAAQFECADAGLKSAEDSIQSLSKLKCRCFNCAISITEILNTCSSKEETDYCSRRKSSDGFGASNECPRSCG